MATIEGTLESETLFNWFNYSEDDYIDGLGGNDVVYGQGGNDTLIGNHASTDWLYGGEGTDQFILYTSNNISAYLEGLWVNGQYTPPHVVDNILGTVHYLADYSDSASISPDTISFGNASAFAPVNVQIFDRNGNPKNYQPGKVYLSNPIVVNREGLFDYVGGAVSFEILDSGDGLSVIDLANISNGGDDWSVIDSAPIFNGDVLTVISDTSPSIFGY